MLSPPSSPPRRGFQPFSPSASPLRPGARTFHAELQPTQSRSICLKTFVIFVVAIGAIGLVAGVLALLASQGVLPSGVNSISELAKLGPVNSSLMILGGVVFFGMGIAAWTRHLRKEERGDLDASFLDTSIIY